MRSYPEQHLWKKHRLIAGCDEAGRGPLAGPVVAAAVILPPGYHHPEIDDSKKLTPAQRSRLFEVIVENALGHAFGIVDVTTIDLVNILNATKIAMREALRGLVRRPELVLIDALRIEDLGMRQAAIVHGDALSLSIAAASILAKVKRDRLMLAYHEIYPQYGFDRHKGYPTREHRAMIQRHGPCPIHRKSFQLLARVPQRGAGA